MELSCVAESWCDRINAKALRREVSAPGQSAKTEKCPLAPGSRRLSESEYWRPYFSSGFSAPALRGRCDTLPVNVGHRSARLSERLLRSWRGCCKASGGF